MVSLFSFGASKETTHSGTGDGQRPELLARKLIVDHSRILLLAGAVAMPFAILSVIQGSYLLFLVSTIALTSGMATLALFGRGHFDSAAAGQVYAIFATALSVTISDPAVLDFGLAIALIAPVQAALLGPVWLKKASWTLPILVGVIALVQLALNGGPSVVDTGRPPTVVAALCFALVTGLVAMAATRLGAGFQIYERSQVAAYRHLIEHVQDAAMRFSPSGELLYSSLSSETLFGCRRYELTSTTITQRVHVLDRPAYMTAFADACAHAPSRIVEVRMRQDDATTSPRVPSFVWVEVSFSAVSGNSEHDHEIIALFRDITERKDHEAAMAEARRKAEDTSHAKSRFLATMGHELRTPLNAVVGFSEMMTSGIGGQLSSTHREYATLIHQSGRHLLDVVSMLLDMSKLEAGKFEVQAEAFMPDSLIQPCFRMVENLALEKQVKLRFESGRVAPMLVADERACRQIIINLLSNAIKFSNDGGEVTVYLKRQGQNLNLTVADTGIGMASHVINRLGEPFFQAQEGLARRYEGTGLGLSIVKGLVELHNGSLRVISEIGVGTSVTVLLPLNGPAIKVEETATIMPLRREPPPTQIAQWHDEKRKAL